MNMNLTDSEFILIATLLQNSKPKCDGEFSMFRQFYNCPEAGVLRHKIYSKARELMSKNKNIKITQ